MTREHLIAMRDNARQAVVDHRGNAFVSGEAVADLYRCIAFLADAVAALSEHQSLPLRGDDR